MESTLIMVYKCKIWFLDPPEKMFRFPYLREEGGGQEGYKNFLIIFFLIRGGEGGGLSKLGRFLIETLFFEGFP